MLLGSHALKRGYRVNLYTSNLRVFDPSRSPEKQWCDQWRRALAHSAPQWHVRYNYPYRGNADGHVAALRREWPASHYLGLELEINQVYPRRRSRSWRQLQQDLCRTLSQILDSH